MEKEPQWLIVEGYPRSGTTILTKLLNTNEKIAISLELNLFRLKLKKKELVEKISLFLNVENKFDLSLISKNASPMILNDKELKIVKRYLGKIIERWHFPLEKIENRFPRLKNFYFPRERIIFKSVIWEYFKDIFVRFIKK